MNRRVLLFLVVCSLSAYAQNWTSFLDSSRAINWSSAGFTVPNYTVNCSTQPTLLTGSSNAGTNATRIQNALASCDATHNVVNIPSGTYYVTSITYPDHGYQVLRGGGADQTTLIFTGSAGCNGPGAAVCMGNSNAVYNGSDTVLPPSGTQQCSWTAGYSQGSTTITLNNCGGAPPVHDLIILDQANDSSDTGGVYICDNNITTCTYNGGGGGNNNGRFIGGADHSQQQVVYTAAVSGSGAGPYTVTISPGVYFSNVRSAMSPGAWWSATVANDGLENLKVDETNDGANAYGIQLYGCYHCWVSGVTSVKAPRNHILLYQSFGDVIRNNYFFSGQNVGVSDSYGIEVEESSALVIENNIFQQATAPIIFGQGSGSVVGYNFAINDQFANNYLNGAYSVHNAGNEFNLFEGNTFPSIEADDAWGSSAQQTYFRNMLIGWAKGRTSSTFPVMMRSFVRDFNLVGNVLGQPGYHNNYQSYATSATAGVNALLENTSIYSLGWGGTDAACSVLNTAPACDARVFSTLMRWGNYDTVNAATQWNATEASPAANTYVSANFSSTYFGSLAHTLPASLYYNSTPSWWPSGKAWPPVGPDVTSGNVGTCSGGTYAGVQATTATQCTGGTLATSWASHVTSLPAQDCYLNVMNGPLDGSGSLLSFNANTCYGATSGTRPASPSGLMAVVH